LDGVRDIVLLPGADQAVEIVPGPARGGDTERVAEDVAEEFPVEREKELDRWSDRWRRRLKSSRRRRTRAT
jgi:hypothetical protein